MLPSTLECGPRIDEQLTELASIMPSSVMLGAENARSGSESPTTPPCQFWTHATSSLLQAIASDQMQEMQSQASDSTTRIDRTATARSYNEPDLGLANLSLIRQCLRGPHLSSTHAATCEQMHDDTSLISRAAQCGSGFDLMEDMTGENEHPESSSPTFRYRSPTDLRLSPTSRAIERRRRRTRPFPRASSSRRASEYERSRLSSGGRLSEPDRLEFLHCKVDRPM